MRTPVPSLRPAHLLRPLACAVALATLPTTLSARELDGQEATVTPDDPPEAWILSNRSHLTVEGGTTYGIHAANESIVTLNNATVTREGNGYDATVELWYGSSLLATGSTFRGGGIVLRTGARAHLSDSQILLDEPGAGFPGHSIGVDLHPLDGQTTQLALNGTQIRVADHDSQSDATSGIGVRIGHGHVVILGGSHVDAAGTAVLMSGVGSQGTPRRLRVHDSTLQSGRRAAIRVDASSFGTAVFNINIGGSARLIGGDGNLLDVYTINGAPSNGQHRVNFEVDQSHLAGNVVRATSATRTELNVTLRDAARIDGRFLGVSRADIDTGSTWQLTGDSDVGDLQLGAEGRVVLGNGTTFNTLALGSLNAAGGTLVFNTALAADDSATDRLVIDGDATGHANVLVNNAGGQGARTDQGIALIRVGGASHAHFDLIGRAVGGQYEYFLIKGTDGHWYLRSEQQAPPDPTDPCLVDPTLPACEVTLPVEPGEPTDPSEPSEPIDPIDPIEPAEPTPVLRPETGAYLANQAAAADLLSHSARDRARHAGGAGSRAWAGMGSEGVRSSAAGQQSLRVQQARLQAGTALGAFDGGQGTVGVMATVGRARATARSAVTGYRAHGTVQGAAAGVYAGWSNETLLMEASTQHGRFNNRLEGDGLPVERYDSRAWQSALEAGLRVGIGRIGGMALSLHPELQASYTAMRMDRHVEGNGTAIEGGDGPGLSTRAGLRIEGVSDAAGVSLRPHLAVSGVHDARSSAMSFDGEVIEGIQPATRRVWSAGADVQWGGWSGSAGIRRAHGSNRYREVGARFDVAYRW